MVHAQEGGNDAYAISPLKNAVNDARAMDTALRACNFRTILVENARKADIDAAFQGVNSYLLHDRVPEAIGLLKAIRIRGTSASTRKANALLQELSAVSQEAGTELQAGIAQPPPIQEVFSGAHFGVPDWDAGARHLETAPVDIGKWTKDLNLPEQAPIQAAQAVVSPPTGPGTAPWSAIGNAIFHVEVLPVGDNRDLKIRRVGSAPVVEPEFGVVEFQGPQGDTPIVYDGKQVAPQVPASVRVPVGKYEIRTMQDGKILNRQDVQVTSASKNVVTVKKP